MTAYSGIHDQRHPRTVYLRNPKPIPSAEGSAAQWSFLVSDLLTFTLTSREQNTGDDDSPETNRCREYDDSGDKESLNAPLVPSELTFLMLLKCFSCEYVPAASGKMKLTKILEVFGWRLERETGCTVGSCDALYALHPSGVA